MFIPGKLSTLSEYYLPISSRPEKSVFFYRIDKYSEETNVFLKKYYQAAQKKGVIIDGGIPNPTTSDLSFFREMMGDSFLLDKDFLYQKLKNWMPRMSDNQLANVVEAVFANLQQMRSGGKNENMLRNAYSKYMCWLYYKFERIAHVMGTQDPPKILYDGNISNYELQFLNVLSRAGTDIVLLERSGDAGYRQLDPDSQYALLYEAPGMGSFPEGYGIKRFQEEIVKDMKRQRLYGQMPAFFNCTNAWMQKATLDQVLVESRARGTDSAQFFNSFIVQYGVEDRLLFPNDIFQFHKQLRSQGRKVCVADGSIPPPSPEEIGKIKRSNFIDLEQMILGLVPNIRCTAGESLRQVMVKSFVDIMLQEGDKPGNSIQKLINKAVYLLCWLERYQSTLFAGWRMPEIGVFILFGRCATENEALFLRMLARLPVDVVVLVPDLNAPCCLQDSQLLELKQEQSLIMEKFPAEQTQLRVNTAAYQAERELDDLMYRDSGMYRDRQFTKAETVTLRTMYEEIAILWNQELKYRPSFSVTNNMVSMPVMLEKVCGVKHGQQDQYWLDIKRLITPDTIVIKQCPWCSAYLDNPVKPFATQFLQNRRLQRNKIKSHKSYQYGILREEIQNYLLDKLQLMLDQKLIRGTYENGTEYTVIATVLNLDKNILRKIQSFDFTKKNPKLLFINTTEKLLSLEDSIIVSFLNLVGFDIVFFVPTGYRCIEKHFNERYINEHQIGEYLYDLTVPDFNTLKDRKQNPLINLFRRSE